MSRIPQRWRDRVAAAPDAVALVDGTALGGGAAPGSGSGSVSCAELDVWSDAFAARLAAAGVRPGDRVGVALARSTRLVAVLLGTLKAGAAYVPVDPADPRTAHMLADAEVSAVVCDPAAGTALAGHGVPRLDPGDRPAVTDPHAARWIPPAGRPEDLACLMYTSGSTGPPKAVMVEHRNITNLVTDASYVDIGPSDRMLQLAPVTFDAATFEIWGALLNGAALVLAPASVVSAAALRDVVRDARITLLWLTAALFHQQVDEEPDTFRDLHTVLTGGDVVSARHVRALLDAVPGCRVVNGYGPTETTTFACCQPIDRDGKPSGSVPIGRPIQNATVRLRDPEGREVPAGEAGEVYIGGAGVTRGYWRRPELTEERFVAGPAGGRLYRTGDLARQREDGAYEFLGRLDDQFKLRGHRIEPGEVESLLMDFPGVRQAAVALRTNHLGDRRLVAYLVAEDPAAGVPDRAALRRFAVARLPGHMIPALFVPVDALPVTRHGKVDRSALPEPEWRRKDSYV